MSDRVFVDTNAPTTSTPARATRLRLGAALWETRAAVIGTQVLQEAIDFSFDYQDLLFAPVPVDVTPARTP